MQLVCDASVAVLVLINAQGDEIEMLPLKPRQMTEIDAAELKGRWAGRGLRVAGLIGLVGTTPRYALKEPLEPAQVSALAGAFLAYLHVLFCDSFAEQMGAQLARQQAGDFVQFAEALCRLDDPRLEA
jgi:hypothetical protein